MWCDPHLVPVFAVSVPYHYAVVPCAAALQQLYETSSICLGKHLPLSQAAQVEL